jgi:hypothetical protein
MSWQIDECSRSALIDYVSLRSITPPKDEHGFGFYAQERLESRCGIDVLDLDSGHRLLYRPFVPRSSYQQRRFAADCGSAVPRHDGRRLESPSFL